MTKSELKEMQEAFERVGQANSTPKEARAFLHNEGLIDKHGKLAEPYASGVAVPTKRP